VVQVDQHRLAALLRLLLHRRDRPLENVADRAARRRRNEVDVVDRDVVDRLVDQLSLDLLQELVADLLAQDEQELVGLLEGLAELGERLEPHLLRAGLLAGFDGRRAELLTSSA
jgi:hypothetical protein